MPRTFALGTLTREHPLGHAEREPRTVDQAVADLDRVTTATLIQRLLEPQHDALRSSLRGLRTLAIGLSRRDRSRTHLLRQAANMLEELAEVMLEQFEHEEQAVFPFLRAGVAPIHVLGELHDHHGDVEQRLTRLRALAADLPAGPTRDRDLRQLVDGLRSFEELVRQHRVAEQQALLARYA